MTDRLTADQGLGIWFRDGIENILLAIDEANLDMVRRFDHTEVRIYRQGFAAAISAVATAFGVRYAASPSLPTQVGAKTLDAEWEERR